MGPGESTHLAPCLSIDACVGSVETSPNTSATTSNERPSAAADTKPNLSVISLPGDKLRLTEGMQSAYPVLETLSSAVVPSPSPSPSATVTVGALGLTSPWVAWATFGAALVAAAAAVWAAVLQRRSGREAAHAAARSAQAAEDAVAQSALSLEASGRRTDQDALHRRFQEASAQLGSSGAAVRMAGVFAMARLADDWDHQRQTCVSVLSGYLRMPWRELDGRAAAEESEIRRTILALIGERTKVAAEGSWSDMEFDFRGARLPKFSWTGSIFRKRPMFQGAQLVEGAMLTACTFAQGVTFAQCNIRAHVWLRGIVVSTGHLMLMQAHVAQGAALTLDIAELGPSATVTLMELECMGIVSVHVRAVAQQQGTVRASGLTLGREARLTVDVEKPESPQLVLNGFLPEFYFGSWSVSRSSYISINEKLGALADYQSTNEE